MRKFGFAIAFFLAAGMVHGREWTDDTGKYHTEAELDDYRVTESVLKLSDGRSIVVPTNRLSVADRQYLEEFARSTPTVEELGGATVAASAIAAPDVVAGTIAQPKVNRPAVRLANYSRQEELPTAEEDAAYIGHYKRIFSGCHGTFHLLRPYGTGAFWLRHHNGHCHHYLTMLKHVPPPAGATPGYVFYKVEDPVISHIVRYFAFQDIETPWCQQNRVWLRRAGSGSYHFYEWAYREVLHP